MVTPAGLMLEAVFPPSSAGLIPGPAHPIPWRALLGDVLLDGESWSALTAMTQLRRCKAGDLAIRRGDAAVAMLALCEGKVAARAPLTGPLWLDLHTAWLEGRYAEDVSVVSASALVLVWPMSVAGMWLRSQPLVLEALVRATAAQLRDAQDAIRGLTMKDATGRVAAWLLAQAGAAGELQFTERKRDVAAQLSISPETLSRTLRQLADRGVVAVQGYRIDLLDRVELLALARAR
ncbi:Crp/Fnr family transcriptional regulator [Mitsuaria sp. 7]|uniref:Crp/Fnr family transcriptional regulator n=1 Tax=Mitsuaria sp. 7 TaxID=1658665 RepID=UPI0012FB07F7|nr:Crp/Fnr family transcriptional regulator [Mitsuaria sp. 7]